MGDALLKALDIINKKHGKGAVINGEEKVEYERTPTGSLGLDIITGGGYPAGKHIVVVGMESSGKTTIFTHAMVEAQKKYPDKKVAIIDSEASYDKDYAEALGLDMNKVIICQPDNGEQGLDIADILVASGEISMLLVDSIATLTPKRELEGEIGDSMMGVQARMMSQAFRVITAKARKTGTTCLWTNQYREKIIAYGNPLTEPAGNASKFYASIKIELKKKTGEDKDENGDIMNSMVTAKTLKNKTAPPFRSCEFDILFGEGVDKISELIFWGVKSNVITKAGSWFSYGDLKIGQGQNTVKDLLKDNPELAEEIESKIRQHYKI